jgi:hypothetical protein
MKRRIAILTVIICLFGYKIQAQAFDKDTKLCNVNLAWGDMVHIPFGAANPYNTDLFGKPIKRVIPTGQFSFQAEFAVHKYVGVGFVVGVGGNPSALFREVNIPLGALANFHFYQFIADKKGKNIHADKIDIYAGITVGAGLAIHPYGINSLFYQSTFYDVLLCIGPHVGLNYYFKKNLAFNAQAGYGVTAFQAGFTFKLGTKGK